MRTLFKKNRRGLVAVGAALLLAGATVVALPVTSAEALPGGVSCYGDYCSGQDPAATGCDRDAVTVASLPIDTGAGQLDLRWSPTCQTNWARWQQYPTGWCLNCTPLALLAVQDTGYQQELDWFDNGTSPTDGSTSWTHMIYSPVHAVYAAVMMPCGGDTLLGAAVDCAANGAERTAAR